MDKQIHDQSRAQIGEVAYVCRTCQWEAFVVLMTVNNGENISYKGSIYLDNFHKPMTFYTVNIFDSLLGQKISCFLGQKSLWAKR